MIESNICPESIRSAASAGVDTRRATLSKSERLHSKKLIDDLFGGGHSKAMSAFPIRLVFMPAPEGESSQMLISVPKRYFHRANKRNRVKRQLREAYRLNKHLLDGQNWLMAFIWLDSELHDSQDVSKCMVTLLTRLQERCLKEKKE